MRTHIFMLLALLLSALIPTFDHHAAERDPGHDHLLFSGPASLTLIHNHGYLHPHAHPMDSTTMAVQSVDQVVSVPTSQGVSGFETGDALLIGPAVMALLLPPLIGGELRPVAILPETEPLGPTHPPPQA